MISEMGISGAGTLFELLEPLAWYRPPPPGIADVALPINAGDF